MMLFPVNTEWQSTTAEPSNGAVQRGAAGTVNSGTRPGKQARADMTFEFFHRHRLHYQTVCHWLS